MQENRLTHLDYLRRTQEDPRNHFNWLMLGWTSDDPKVALEFFEEALTLKPGNPEVLDSIVWAKERIAHPQGKLELSNINEEVRELQKAYQPEPSGLDIPTRPRHPRKIYWRVLVSRRMLQTWLGLYFSAIALAEILTSIVKTLSLGLILHGIVLLLLVVHSALVVSRREQRLFLTLAFAPLIRMVSLSIPLKGIPQIYWYMIVGIPLFLAGFLVMRYADFDRREIGFSGRRWPWQILIGVGGIGLGYLEYSILRPKPLISQITVGNFVLPAFILLIFTGLLEEFIFRGLMQRAFITLIGPIEGILYVSFIFAVLHFGYRSVLDAIFVFWVALLFSTITYFTGSILGATIAHGLTNITLYLVFPLVFYSASPVTVPTPVSTAQPSGIQPQILTVTPLPTGPSSGIPFTPTSTAIELIPSTSTPTFLPSDTLAPVSETATPTLVLTPEASLSPTVTAIELIPRTVTPTP
ncbi:MAG TPA: CPBP family glutamic-type intramembrane protease [Anaerolineales bacterium]|nr:CPBP family glutamic-type intramembrane protease [Anaerolineales bacterium]